MIGNITDNCFLRCTLSCNNVFLSQKTSQVNPEGNSDVSMQTIHKKKFKIVKMLILVAVLFVLCWLPYFTLLILQVGRGHLQGI